MGQIVSAIVLPAFNTSTVEELCEVWLCVLVVVMMEARDNRLAGKLVVSATLRCPCFRIPVSMGSCSILHTARQLVHPPNVYNPSRLMAFAAPRKGMFHVYRKMHCDRSSTTRR